LLQRNLLIVVVDANQLVSVALSLGILTVVGFGRVGCCVMHFAEIYNGNFVSFFVWDFTKVIYKLTEQLV
jgi:hypothetical protein